MKFISYWLLCCPLFIWAQSPSLLEKAQAEFDAGNLKEAKVILDDAYSIYQSENDYASLVSTLGALGDYYFFSGQRDTAISLYKKSIEIGARESLDHPMVHSLATLAFLNYMQGEYHKTIPLLKEAIEKADTMLNQTAHADHLNLLGDVYAKLNYLDSAELYLVQALSFRQRHQTANLVHSYNALARFHNQKGEYRTTIDYEIKTAEALLAAKDSANLAMAYHNIAETFIFIDNWHRAEDYAKRGLQLAEQLNLKSTKSELLHLYGRIQLHNGEYKIAENYFKESLAIAREKKLKRNILGILKSMINLHLSQKEAEAAKNYLDEAIPLALELNISDEIILVNLQAIRYKLMTQQWIDAKKIIIQTVALTRQTKQAHLLSQTLSFYSQLEEKLGNDGLALQYLRQANHLNDSIRTEAQSRVVNELEARFQRVQQDQQISRLNATNQSQSIEISRSQRTIMLVVLALVLTIIAALAIFMLLRLKQKTNQQLERQKDRIAKALKEKEVLLQEIHHRVKNNLQVISSLLNLQSRYISDEKASAAIQEGRNRVRSMALIHQNLYGEDAPTSLNAAAYVEQLTQSLFHNYNIDAGRIHLQTDIDPIDIDIDTIIPIGLILNELISNALKYAFPGDEQGMVQVKLKHRPEELFLVVEDNGVGKTESQQEGSLKSGFGLKMIETFARKLKASLEIDHSAGTAVSLRIKNFKLT